VEKTTIEVPSGYASLFDVLARALEQASKGKGKDRHANNDAFEDQIMCYMAQQLGIAAPVFQVCKKSIEACRLPYPQNVNELLGAINYAAGAVIEIERKVEADSEELPFVPKAKNVKQMNGGINSLLLKAIEDAEAKRIASLKRDSAKELDTLTSNEAFDRLLDTLSNKGAIEVNVVKLR